MRALLATLALSLAAVPVAGCLRTTTFTCAGDQECSGGTCETNNYCSFADGTCDSGRRYGDLSGPVANQCVGEEQPDAPPGTPDARADAPPMIDAPSNCPGTYAPVTGAPNVYHLLGVDSNWVNQQVACTSEGGYLMIPEADNGELEAITAFAGDVIWIGISDRATEGVWLDVRGGTATFLPWAGGQPDDSSPGEDCVLADTNTISDERCSNVQAIAVCECDP